MSTKYKYQLQLPTGWNLSEAESGVPTFFNYKVSQAGPQGLFPSQGAETQIIPFGIDPRTGNAKTLNDWVSLSFRNNYSNVSLRHIGDIRNDDSVLRDVVKIEADFERNSQDDNLQHEVSYFFSLREAMFRLRLVYWKGNVEGKRLQAVCESILRTIRKT